jgi:hypothetical protein
VEAKKKVVAKPGPYFIMRLYFRCHFVSLFVRSLFHLFRFLISSHFSRASQSP